MEELARQNDFPNLPAALAAMEREVGRLQATLREWSDSAEESSPSTAAYPPPLVTPEATDKRPPSEVA